MKWPLTLVTWPRAALAAAALAFALIASVVGGRQEPAPATVPAAAPVARPPAQNPATGSGADLDLETLKRPATGTAIVDLFALPASPSAEVQPPPAPGAPPLPFTYLGKLIDGGRLTVFLARGDEHYVVEQGSTIEKIYQVEQVTETAVTFIYLPLRTRQTLPILPLN
jgi:hypothetical protein